MGRTPARPARPDHLRQLVRNPGRAAIAHRARLTLPADDESSGTKIQEREVVRGKVRAIYEVRCDCGKRWFHTRFERVQLCLSFRCTRTIRWPRVRIQSCGNP